MDEAKLNSTGIEHRSLSELLSEGLGRENAQALEQFFSQFKDHLRAGHTYIEENPREALAIAASVGLTAWILMGTKPGRRLFTPALIAFMPRIKTWLNDVFAASPSKSVPATAAASASLQHH